MTIEKLATATPDLTQQNIERLLELFPECRTEGSREDAPMVDFDLLRQTLSDYLVEGPAERYRLDWPGKRQALLTANTSIDKTLRPMREESVDFDSTRNLFIEGDNLDALKLLQETYLGKVKMIYIDPPYNTGKDFIYRDNFAQSRADYEEASGQRDEADGLLIANTESSGRFHSNWLSMMYPRLKLARNLLADDGAIFISCDDGERDNLVLILNEVFGKSNFVAAIIWQKKYAVSNDDPNIGVMHDYVLCVRKSEAFARNLLPRTEKQLARYKNPDNHPLGRWSSDNYISNKSRVERPTLYYPIKHPKTGEDVWPDEDAVWRYNKEKHEQMVAEDRLYWGPEENYSKPRLKRFLKEIQGGLVPSTWWPHEEVGHNDEAQKETGRLLGKKVFDTPKPIRLLERIIEISASGDDLVMDFFAGSGAFAHAVMARNVNAGESLRYIVVQLSEQTQDASYAQQAGFSSISNIALERIRLAGNQLLEENPELENVLDVGFRGFRIDSGNYQDTTVTPKDATQASLAGMVDHIKDDRTDEDLLFGALLRWGVDITLPVERRELAGRKVWFVDPPEDGSGKKAALIACFERPKSGKGGIDTSLADAMSELTPLRVLFRDDGFADDATKENVHSRFQQRAPDTQVRVL